MVGMEPSGQELPTFTICLILFVVLFAAYVQFCALSEEQREKYVNFSDNIKSDLIKKHKLERYNERELFSYCLNRTDNISENFFITNKVQRCNEEVNEVIGS